MRLHHQLERPTQSKLWIPRWTRDLSENVHLQSYLIINKAIKKKGLKVKGNTSTTVPLSSPLCHY